jgi:Uma2 family endonuclease
MIDLIVILGEVYRDRPDVYVGGNMLFYYIEGDPRRSLAPDVFVALGVPRRERRIYKLWEEGKGPDLIIEITSRSTRDEDLLDKKLLYEQTFMVREYLLYDPIEEYLVPSFQGYRLVEGTYEPIEMQEGRYTSHTLGLEFRSEEGALRVYDPVSGKRLLAPAEAYEAHRQAEARATQAEAEIIRLRAQLEQIIGRSSTS